MNAVADELRAWRSSEVGVVPLRGSVSISCDRCASARERSFLNRGARI